ncbi:PIN domain-like protein [Phascolomyces articulosus]|uniref:PIN domain-like protein n=1 Tax=Phascolomyces articulosus TaxID=60185 RepID=A0AAD5KH56_9FUNG|nr:PIN domain-like protein [Phascolomyces articulosus]
MGVHSLTAVLRRYAPQSLKTKRTHAFSNQVIAFDASCHLNKFIYGEEVRPHRHVYGFYLMARYCQLHNITPIFVFDGAYRIAAKQLEHSRREKSRRKIQPSLDYERARSVRLASWTNAYRDLSDDAATRILEQLLTTTPPTRSAISYPSKETTPMTKAKTTMNESDTDRAKKVDDEVIEKQLVQLATDLNDALELAEDTEKYTRTVRGLSAREHAVMTSMIRDRIEDTDTALQDLQNDNQQMMSSLEKRSIRITQALRQECLEFLRTLGFICMTCEHHEAEAMCSELARQNITTATVTEDMDALVFGDAPILRYFFARNRPILEIDPVIAREQLHLTRDQFIDFCILSGTDFSGTIQGIGPIRALEYIQRYGSIEHILDDLSNTKYSPSDTFNYKLAREVRKTIHTNIHRY